jgi:hypothetical protein
VAVVRKRLLRGQFLLVEAERVSHLLKGPSPDLLDARESLRRCPISASIRGSLSEKPEASRATYSAVFLGAPRAWLARS